MGECRGSQGERRGYAGAAECIEKKNSHTNHVQNAEPREALFQKQGLGVRRGTPCPSKNPLQGTALPGPEKKNKRKEGGDSGPALGDGYRAKIGGGEVNTFPATRKQVFTRRGEMGHG